MGEGDDKEDIEVHAEDDQITVKKDFRVLRLVNERLYILA